MLLSGSASLARWLGLGLGEFPAKRGYLILELPACLLGAVGPGLGPLRALLGCLHLAACDGGDALQLGRVVATHPLNQRCRLGRPGLSGIGSLGCLLRKAPGLGLLLPRARDLSLGLGARGGYRPGARGPGLLDSPAGLLGPAALVGLQLFDLSGEPGCLFLPGPAVFLQEFRV